MRAGTGAGRDDQSGMPVNGDTKKQSCRRLEPSWEIFESYLHLLGSDY